MKRIDVLSLGFKEIGHFTVMNSLTFDLGRNRLLSFGCIGEPNEMMFICQRSKKSIAMEDLVCIHNYDYDGLMTLEKLKLILKALK